MDRHVWEVAGALGLDPAPFTLRELLRMHEGRQRAAWEHTSHLLWMIYTMQRSAKSPAKRPEDFNPVAQRKAGGKSRKMSVLELKGMFA